MDSADVLAPDAEAGLAVKLREHLALGRTPIAVVTVKTAGKEGIEHLAARFAKGWRARAPQGLLLIIAVREQKAWVDSLTEDYNQPYYTGGTRVYLEFRDHHFEAGTERIADRLLVATTPYGALLPADTIDYRDPEIWLRGLSAVLLWVAWFFVSCGVGYWAGGWWSRRPRRPWDDPQGPVLLRLALGVGLGCVPLLFDLGGHLFLAAMPGVFVGWPRVRVLRRALLIAAVCLVLGTLVAVVYPALLVIVGSLALVIALVRYLYKAGSLRRLGSRFMATPSEDLQHIDQLSPAEVERLMRSSGSAPSTSLTYTPPEPESDPFDPLD